MIFAPCQLQRNLARSGRGAPTGQVAASARQAAVARGTGPLPCPRRAPAAALRSRRMVVDGVDLHWTEQGEGSPLILLHGLADSQCTWRAVTSVLAQRYRVFGLDLPGCGLSGRPDASYSLDWQARLTAAWLDRMALPSYDVMGHSYGGGVALSLLLYRAKAVRKLALVAPGGLGSEVTPFLRLAAVGGLLEAAGQVVIGPITQLVLRLHGSSLTNVDRRLLCRINSSPGTGRAFARTVRDVIDWRGQTRQAISRLHEVEELPAIALFWGENDRVIPMHHGKSLCSLLENCSLWPVPNAGHFLHWQAPAAIARAILAYLDAPTLTRSRLRPAQGEQHRASRACKKDATAA